MNIYVSNLNYNVDESNLRELFSQFGEITSVNLITDKETGRSRGFAFVEMEDEAGQTAIKSLDQTDLMGRNIMVAKAREKEDRSSSFGSDKSKFSGRNNKW